MKAKKSEVEAGDLQGLQDDAEAAELLEDGQYFEASVVSGIKNAPSADAGPVKTRQVPEDDVPSEYLDEVEFRK